MVMRWSWLVVVGVMACSTIDLPDGALDATTAQGNECNDSADCSAPDAICVERFCELGYCRQRFTAAGTPTASQLEGNCQIETCDGAGESVLQSDADDPFDDGNVCTADSCGQAGPSNEPLAEGTPCMQGGGIKCNYAGVCVPCLDAADCLGACGAGTCICSKGSCLDASCEDGVKNGSETGQDCGGDCNPCADGEPCNDGSDCSSEICTDDGLCASASCTDGARNGLETDIDCGGPSCPGCSAGQVCAQMDGSDCVSGVCSRGLCQAATCTDAVHNGTESDIDCGGSDCQGCLGGQKCNGTADCHMTLTCVKDLCVPPTPDGEE